MTVPVDDQRIPKSFSPAPCAARLAAVEISHATRDGDRIRGETPGVSEVQGRESAQAGERLRGSQVVNHLASRTR